jgi:hypothetical protein
VFYDIFVERFLVVSSFPVPALYSFGSPFPLCLLCVSSTTAISIAHASLVRTTMQDQVHALQYVPSEL